MPCRPELQRGTRESCLLGLTLLLLVCEIIVSRLCNSLINMVDSFHTLFIFLRLSLPHLTPRSPSAPSSSSTPISHTLPSSDTPVTASNTPIIPTTANSSLHPVTHPAPTYPASHVLPAFTSALSPPYGWVRVQPLGALISSLLLASLCISVSMDIFSHALSPHPMDRPLLATAVGAISLLFNTMVLAMSRGGLLELEGGFTHLSSAGEDQGKDSTVIKDARNKIIPITLSQTVDKSVRDGTLVFCNPGASSVLDPECHTQCSPSLCLGPSTHTQTLSPILEPWTQLNSGFQQSGNHGEPPGGSHHLNNPYSEVSEDNTRVESRGSTTGIGAHSVLHSGTERPGISKWWCCPFPGLISLVQALLGSILVLANGLILLLSDPDCPHSTAGCGLLVYLDPGFSMLAVLVFLTTTLPQACRHGFLLLQGTPPNFALDELSCRIAGVPGVVAVHDLHVWQLTEACLVASVHVHCHPGLGACGCSDLLAGVTDVLRSAGVSCSTVQPELLPTVTDLTAAGTSLPQGILTRSSSPHCILACGTECAGKMCCTPRKKDPRLSSTGKFEEVQPQLLIIENTYL